MHGGSGSFGATFRRLLNSIPVDVAIVDGSGNHVTSFGGTGGTSSSFGAAFPATGTAAGAMDVGGNMAALNLDASGNLKVTSGGGGGGAVTVADGADVTQGALADAANTTGTTGTLSGKLRGLVIILADVWDSVNHWLKVQVQGTVAVSNAGLTNLDVALSTRLKPADTLTKVTTVDTITNVVHVDDNAGSLTVDSPNLDVALSTRLKPADTLTKVATVDTITNVVHVDDNAGSITVDGTVSVNFGTGPYPADGSAAPTVKNPSEAVYPLYYNGSTFDRMRGDATEGLWTNTKRPRTGSAPAQATVGVASASAVASNASRKGLILTNVSSARISFGIANTAVLDSGITLYPGGVWEMDEYTFSTGAINAIASAAASALAVQELT